MAACAASASFQLFQNTNGIFQFLQFLLGTIPVRPQLREYLSEVRHVISS